MEPSRRAIIMAGGKGTRLAPQTQVFPKPLAVVGPRPLVHTLVLQLARAGFHRVTIATGHLGPLMRAYFECVEELPAGLHLDFLHEERPRGTIGALAAIESIDESVLVVNGDLFTDLDFRAFADEHAQREAIFSIAVHRQRIPLTLGEVRTDEADRVTAYLEKPVKEYVISSGIYLVEPEVLAELEPDRPVALPDLVNRLCRRGRHVAAWPHEAFWMDLNLPEDFGLAEAEIERNPAAYLVQPP